jgi:hypothetical protein
MEGVVTVFNIAGALFYISLFALLWYSLYKAFGGDAKIEPLWIVAFGLNIVLLLFIFFIHGAR